MKTLTATLDRIAEWLTSDAMFVVGAVMATSMPMACCYALIQP